MTFPRNGHTPPPKHEQNPPQPRPELSGSFGNLSHPLSPTTSALPLALAPAHKVHHATPAPGPPPSRKGKELARPPSPPTPPTAAEDPKYLIPFSHTKPGKDLRDPKKYARLFPHSYEAGEYRRGAYDVPSFTPRNFPPDNAPSPSYAQAASGFGSGGKGKVSKQPSPPTSWEYSGPLR